VKLNCFGFSPPLCVYDTQFSPPLLNPFCSFLSEKDEPAFPALRPHRCFFPYLRHFLGSITSLVVVLHAFPELSTGTSFDPCLSYAAPPPIQYHYFQFSVKHLRPTGRMANPSSLLPFPDILGAPSFLPVLVTFLAIPRLFPFLSPFGPLGAHDPSRFPFLNSAGRCCFELRITDYSPFISPPPLSSEFLKRSAFFFQPDS